ncbi:MULTISPECIES: hypothetical protein [unclassified Streptomyces]|uniref:hypothetical protein n=1 Tax=unclassified Streptomyces TaxID=2593676 RepID=UPI002259765E|nr:MULTISPECIES: hypothetical protein [unclassified Streptomyces]MCX4990366.1 hypothetical protein [Streptomyces sp. NBC_00568]MCX5004403.1 hypothetical protein [Streptomyces sp. NBC_00638]
MRTKAPGRWFARALTGRARQARTAPQEGVRLALDAPGFQDAPLVTAPLAAMKAPCVPGVKGA